MQPETPKRPTAIVKKSSSASELGNGDVIGWSRPQIELIKSQLINKGGERDPGTSDEELAYFWQVCKLTGLSPFQRQIYAIRRWDKASNGYKMAIQVSIGGMRAIASRTGQYAGSEEALFDEGLTLYEHKQTQRAKPCVARITVYRLVGGVRCPFTGVAAWEEFSQSSPLWSRMPYNQLAKCAESQALSKAFPEETSYVEFTTNDDLPNTGTGSRASEDFRSGETWGKFEFYMGQAIAENDAQKVAKAIAWAHRRVNEGSLPSIAVGAIDREEAIATEKLLARTPPVAVTAEVVESAHEN